MTHVNLVVRLFLAHYAATRVKSVLDKLLNLVVQENMGERIMFLSISILKSTRMCSEQKDAVHTLVQSQ